MAKSFEERARNKKPLVRSSVATDEKAPLNLLELLSNDLDDMVRGDVATNESASEDILRKLSKDLDESVRCAVASNSLTPLADMKDNSKQMTANNLKVVSKLFLEKNNVSEHKLARFSLDIYFPEDRIAFEYDGPDHYDKVANHERDLRKNQLCLSEGIKLVRWPYYFQLTKDVARYLFPNYYTDNKYQEAIKIVYGASDESQILAPGLHGSKFTPANFTSLGIKRFIGDFTSAPISLRSQVIHSFHLYEKMIVSKHGKDFLWLLYPQDSVLFDEFMKHKPDTKFLNYVYKNKKYFSQSV